MLCEGREERKNGDREAATVEEDTENGWHLTPTDSQYKSHE